MFDYPYTAYADCMPSGSPFEMSQVKNGNVPKSIERELVTAGLSKSINESLVNAKEWLPFAAEAYDISPHIQDHIIVPVPLFTSSIPNKNGVAFPFDSLSAFSVESGCLAYKTWKGKPTFVEHRNKIPTDARGVIFDVSMQKRTDVKGELWQVIALCSFDRNKFPESVNDILTGKSKSYSMGTLVTKFACSVCEADIARNPCDHVQVGTPNWKMHKDSQGKSKLGFLNGYGLQALECSIVETGAFVEAQHTQEEIMNLRDM